MDAGGEVVRTSRFALVIAEMGGKYLAVDEAKNRGWWLPAGHCDEGQGFIAAAHRETDEEAGMAVTLTGVLRIEVGSLARTRTRMRVLFAAEPVDPSAAPKSVPDSESNGAAWCTPAELAEMRLRGPELLEWGAALNAERSGQDSASVPLVAPMEVFVTARGVAPFGAIEPQQELMDLDTWILGPRPVDDWTVDSTDDLGLGTWSRATGCPSLFSATVLVAAESAPDTPVGELARGSLAPAASVKAGAKALIAAGCCGAQASQIGLVRVEELVHGAAGSSFHFVFLAVVPDAAAEPVAAAALSPKAQLYAALVAREPGLPAVLDQVLGHEGGPPRPLASSS